MNVRCLATSDMYGVNGSLAAAAADIGTRVFGHWLIGAGLNCGLQAITQ